MQSRPRPQRCSVMSHAILLNRDGSEVASDDQQQLLMGSQQKREVQAGRVVQSHDSSAKDSSLCSSQSMHSIRIDAYSRMKSQELEY